MNENWEIILRDCGYWRALMEERIRGSWKVLNVT